MVTAKWSRCPVAVLMLSVVAVMAAAVEPVSRADGTTAKPPGPRIAVAVLPFASTAEAPDSSYLQNGIPRLMGSALREVSGVRLLSRYAVAYALREKKLKAGTAFDAVQARSLGEVIEAPKVVYGSYRREGAQWSVTAQVLDVASGKAGAVIIAASADWWEIRDELVNGILKELGVSPPEPERLRMRRQPTASPEALELYLKAASSQDSAQKTSETLLRDAAARDPNFVEALVGLGVSLFNQGRMPEAESQTRLAITINPELGEAHANLGLILVHGSKFEEARKELVKASVLDPDDPGSLIVLAQLCAAQGQLDEAIGWAQQAVDRDRTSADNYGTLGLLWANKGNREKALAALREIERYGPDDIGALQMSTQAYRLLGEKEKARRDAMRFVEQSRKQGMNEQFITAFEEIAREIEATMTSIPVEAALPREYTADELRAELERKLTPEERSLAANPLETSPALARWAEKLVEGATDEKTKALRLYDALCKRIPSSNGGHAPIGHRTAAEVCATWEKPGLSFDCRDLSWTCVALARAAGLKAWPVWVEQSAPGEYGKHMCAAVLVDGKVFLADPEAQWFGASYTSFTLLDDRQAIAYHAMLGDNGLPGARVATKMDPESLPLQLLLGLALLSEGENGEALKVAENLERRFPGQWDVHMLHGMVQEHRQQYAEANRLLQEAVRLNPRSGDSHFWLAMALLHQDQPASARAHLRLYLSNEPRGSRVEEALRLIAEINAHIGPDDQPAKAPNAPEPSPAGI